MIFDSHIHTEISFDSEMPLEAARAAARERNIGLVLTEHIDFDFPGGGYVFAPADYFARYADYRSDSLLLGVEIGMQADCCERNRRLIGENDFDCVIGSLHVLAGVDLYEPSFYEKQSKQAVYAKYFQVTADCLRQHAFVDAWGISTTLPAMQPMRNRISFIMNLRN